MKNNYIKTTISVYLIVCLFGCVSVAAQPTADSLQIKIPGFVDKNKDGINDVFVDANGDGKNDITGQPYFHKFEFVDENQDGLNDLWQDRDGDGVNDFFPAQLKKKGIKLKMPWIDKDGDGLLDPDVKPKYDADLRQFVLDMDNDGKNDITGSDVTEENIMGYRYGCIDEENDKYINKFTDNDGDGMHDPFENRLNKDMKQGGRGRNHDYFIDRDGDGIADGRGFGQLKKQSRQKGRGKKGNR